MKRVSLIVSAVVITAMMFTSFVNPSTNEVTIGDQVWMAKNLNVEKFRNGDTIPHAKTKEEWEKAGENEQPAWCYYNNNPENGDRYGKLYNWYAVNDPRGLAPEGWHIPSDKEWKQLIENLGGEKVAGGKMKSTSGWNEDGNGTNESGFDGRPGGLRKTYGTFAFKGSTGYWWSSTESFDDRSALKRSLFYSKEITRSFGLEKRYGLSVRCIRN